VRDVLRRLPLERAVEVSVFIAIVGAVAASAGISELVHVGRMARLVGLALLAGVAGASAIAWGVGPLRKTHFALLLLALIVVSSAGWSVDPAESAADGLAFATLTVSAALATLSIAQTARGVRPIVRAVVAAMAFVALAGVIRLALDPDETLGEATPVDPPYYAGVGGNANTVPLLLAVGLPLSVAGLLGTRTHSGRAAWGLLTALLGASIVGSGSRGALASAFAGVLVVAIAMAPSRGRRVLSVAIVVCVFVVAALVASIPDPDPSASRSYAAETQASMTGGRYFNANAYRRLEDDIGHPPFGEAARLERPSLLGSSGRLDAWRLAIRDGAERPLLGFGFGQEDKGYTDRLASSEADLPENAYVGLFVQIGAVGVTIFAVFAGLMLAHAGRRLGRVPSRERDLVAGLAGAVSAGLVIALVQSYLFSPGSVASAAFWLCAFSLVALLDVST
jgi:hypothetical protein